MPIPCQNRTKTNYCHSPSQVIQCEQLVPMLACAGMEQSLCLCKAKLVMGLQTVVMLRRIPSVLRAPGAAGLPARDVKSSCANDVQPQKHTILTSYAVINVQVKSMRSAKTKLHP